MGGGGDNFARFLTSKSTVQIIHRIILYKMFEIFLQLTEIFFLLKTKLQCLLLYNSKNCELLNNCHAENFFKKSRMRH